jgi:hypothetical protein
MTTEIKEPTLAATLAPGVVPFTPEEIVTQLRILRMHIPDFGPLSVRDAAGIRTAAHVHDDLVRAATNTAGASTFVAGPIGKDAGTLRVERENVSRWSAVEDELQTMYKGVAAANLTHRYRLGLSVLQVYAITRQLVRQKAHADLLPHFEEMRRVNKFKRKRAAQPAEPPPVVPAPVPPKP